MVSRRNFISIIMIMLVLLFMFQFTGVAKETWNEYKTNQNADETKSNLTQKDVYDAQDVAAKEQVTTGEYVIYLGNLNDKSTGNTVKQWCDYTKRPVVSNTSLIACETQIDAAMPEVLLLDSNYLQSEDYVLLEQLVEQGVNAIFCNIPSVEKVDTEQELKSILGIEAVVLPQVELTGIKTFAGFLIGGEQWYTIEEEDDKANADLNFDVPWYLLGTGVKVYFSGMVSKEYGKIENELLPSLIWRHSVNGTFVYVVNGDYMKDSTGIGILDAMMTELHDYEIYPVVNAQAMVALNYPTLTNENETEMMKRYSRNSHSVFRDVVWPGLASLASRTDARLTCLMSPQFDYSDDQEPSADMLQYYLKLFNEQKAEAGLTLSIESETDVTEKLDKDYDFVKEWIPEYQFTSLYVNDEEQSKLEELLEKPLLSGVQTLLVDYDGTSPMLSYAADHITQLQTTNDGFSHTFSEDLRMRSVETALGYSVITADMKRVLYPEGAGDEWEKLYEALSSNSTTFWKPYTSFEQTTLSESAARVREFLALDYEDTRAEDTIELSVDKNGENAYFILRTHNERITQIDGATYTPVEEDVYLLDATDSTVTIELEKRSQLYYQNK